MNSLRTFSSLLLALWMLGLSAPAWAADGTVVNEEREPIEGARVCYFIDTVELICTLTDDQGRFELPVSDTDTIRAHAEGYNPTSFSSAAQQGPVTLKRSPVLLVHLRDGKSGEPIEKGEVLIVYPSGKEFGPFPTNKAGLRIRRGLRPGQIRVVGKAEGYQSSSPVEVTLEPGEQVSAALELAALEADEQPE